MAENGDVSTVSKDECVEWNTEQELSLFQQVIRLKPIGGTRQWKIMCIRKRVQESLPGLEITSDMIWNKLNTMFDLKAIEEMEKEEDGITVTDYQFELPEEFHFSDAKLPLTLMNLALPSSENGKVAANGFTAEVEAVPVKAERSQRRRTPSVSEEPRITRRKSKSSEHAPEALTSNMEETETVKKSPVKPVDAEALVEHDEETTRNKEAPELEKPSKISTQPTRRRKKSLSVNPKCIEEVTKISPIPKNAHFGSEHDPEMPQLEPAALVAPETAADDEAANNNTLDDDIVTPLTPAQPQPPKPRKKKMRKQSDEKQTEPTSYDGTKTRRAKRSTSKEGKADSKKSARSANTK